MSTTESSLATEATLSSVKVSKAKAPTFKPGTVEGVSLDQQVASVAVDGDAAMFDDTGGDDFAALSGLIPCQIIAPSAFLPGDRVMIMFAPPHGAFVAGRLAGDYNNWAIIGQTGQIQFVSPWGGDAGAAAPGTPDTFGWPMYRRCGRFVELRGRAARYDVSAPNPDTIFVLPQGFRPQNDLVIPAICGPIAIPSFCIIQSSGEVQALVTGGTTLDGGGGFFNLDGIIFSIT